MITAIVAACISVVIACCLYRHVLGVALIVGRSVHLDSEIGFLILSASIFLLLISIFTAAVWTATTFLPSLCMRYPLASVGFLGFLLGYRFAVTSLSMKKKY